MDFAVFKIEVYLPEASIEALREAIHAAGACRVGNYDHCVSITSVRGYWRPLESATPYCGDIGRICEGTECKVEFQCPAEHLAGTLAAIRRVHPYEEPLINIIPLWNGRCLPPGEPPEKAQ